MEIEINRTNGYNKAKKILTSDADGKKIFEELINNVLRNCQPIGPEYEVQDIERDDKQEIMRVITSKRHPVQDAVAELGAAIGTILQAIDSAKSKGVGWK